MVQMQLLWFFSPFPQAHGRPFLSTPKPNTATWDAERRRFARARTCYDQELPAELLIENLDLAMQRGPPSLGPNIFRKSGS